MRAWFRSGVAAGIMAFAASGVAMAASAVEDANAAVQAARQGNYEEAIELFTNAINSDELTLKSRAQAYAYRGIAKAAIGDYDSAGLDLNSAVVLDSDYNADAFAFRGFFHMARGENKEAAADLVKSADISVWSYSALWLYLARTKAGVADEGPHSLSAHVAVLAMQTNQDGSTNMTRWPAPVVNFMLGKANEAEIRAAANAGDQSRLGERVCDVDFYLAELDLAKGNTVAAKPKLEAAAKGCPFASFERMGAAAELERMK